jgi:apolipoprotein D and lipocalin family protein
MSPIMLSRSPALLGAFVCCAVGAIAARVKPEDARLGEVVGGSEPCSDAAAGASRRESAWRRKLECKCKDGSLFGFDSACGDGTQRYFSAAAVTGKGCICMKNKKCEKVETQPDFNLTSYISKPWFIQQQMPTQYLPVEKNYCVTARYEVMPKPTFWRYTIQVYNQAADQDGNVMDSGTFLCAHNYKKTDPAKLAVAPCFLPKAVSGRYWVLAYSEEEGYALVSGGQPFIETPFGCRMGSGTNDAGLWIFTRVPNPSKGLVETVRRIANRKGFDLSVLNDVKHPNCTVENYVSYAK